MLDVKKLKIMYGDKNCSILDLCDIFNVTLIEMADIFKENNITLKRSDVGHVANRFKSMFIPKSELIYQFITLNKTREEVAEYFNCSTALIKKRCQMYGIKKSQKQAVKNAQKTIKGKYGVDRLCDVNKEQRKETCKEKYGAETPFQSYTVQSGIFKQKQPSQEELRVMEILQVLNIEYEREIVFNPEGAVIISFDIKMLLGHNDYVLIEVDGYFHRMEGVDGDRKRYMDEFKDRFCKENNIKLLRIPTNLTNIDICKQILKYF